MVYDAIWINDNMIGIYKITNPKGKIYIGSSNNIPRRMLFYKNLHCKGQCKIYRSIIKYGWENHTFEIVELCSLENLRLKEHEYGVLYDVLSDNGLNLSIPKIGDSFIATSDETRTKISNAHKKIYSADVQKRLYEAKKKVGWIQKEETKSKISKTLSKRVIHIESKQEFNSLKEAAAFFNIPYGSLTCEMSKREENRPSHRRGKPKKQKRFEYL